MGKGSKIQVPPKKLDLRRYVDFELEAEKFELTTKRVSEIAIEVAEEQPDTLNFTVSQTVSETALKDRLTEIYNQEAAEIKECNYPGCEHKYTDIHDFLAHHRVHLIESSPDPKVRASIIRDIERTLVPTVERTAAADGALPTKERERIVRALRERAMLPAGFDSPGDKPERQN